MRILVTGGAGFIGSHLVDRLVENKLDVVVVDKLLKPTHINGVPTYINSKAKYYWEDIGSLKKSSEAFKDIDVIFHLASFGGVTHSISKYYKENTLTTANFLQSIKELKRKPSKIIVASSMAVYGEGKYYDNNCNLHFPESRSLEDLLKLNWDFSVNGGKLTPQKSNENDYIRPLTHYALSKYDQERMVLNFCQTEDISGLATRFYLTYGPRQSLSNPYTGIFSIFSSQILNGCSPVIFEDGNQTRDLIFVDDLIDGLMILLDSKPNDRKIYNIGTGKSQRIIDIAKLLAFKINKNIKIEHSNNFRIGDVRNTMSDISAMNELGFFSKTSLDNGVNKYLDWFYSQKMIKSNFKNAFTKLAKNGIIKISK